MIHRVALITRNRLVLKHLARVAAAVCLLATAAIQAENADLLLMRNERVTLGIDRSKGGAITWLSWTEYPRNMVNLYDPGRLIQQSYYAGNRRDRLAEGQGEHWSPWSWNPIQGGGLTTWSRVTVFERLEDGTLHAETVPKLWDMPNEEANAVMRQWTDFEAGMPDAIRVTCELVCQREDHDAWGVTGLSPQEVPACYFTRNFESVKTYLGQGQWRVEDQPPGPPWGRAKTPYRAMAFFEKSGQGVAVYSPSSSELWNFGPHVDATSDDPYGGPCMHVAPVVRIDLRPKSTFRYRYWLLVGNQSEIVQGLDRLIQLYADDSYDLINP